MRTWTAVVTSMSVMLAPLATAESSGAPCQDVAFLEDPGNDVTLAGVSDLPTDGLAPAAIDILSAALSSRNDSLHMEVALASAPEFGASIGTYRYWFGFDFKVNEGPTQSMDLRIGRTISYDSGILVSSNEHGNQGLAELPVVWQGSTASFDVPWSILAEAYGGPITIESPTAQADGRSATTHVQGAPVGAVFIDYLFGDDRQSPLCPFSPAEAIASLPPAATDGPLPIPAVSMLPLLAVGLLVVSLSGRRAQL
jgi:hypothetical protein